MSQPTNTPVSPTTQKSTKIFIPVPDVENTVLAGVLEQLAPEEPTQGRRLALILHGTMGHKDYLFLKRLAQRLPTDSFRFDFRANHESTGAWRFAGFVDDVEDIRAVVAYLTKEFGYIIDLVVGHSRGSVAGLRWMCTSEEGKGVRGYVNASGRYTMPKVYDYIPQAHKDLLKVQGYYTLKVMVARKEFIQNVTEADLIDFSTFDTSLVWDQFPQGTHTLTIHGFQDRVVPPSDAMVYARALGSRHPGTHNLFYLEEADHNFSGLSDLVVDNILDWFAQLEQNQLKTGVWRTGVRGKL